MTHCQGPRLQVLHGLLPPTVLSHGATASSVPSERQRAGSFSTLLNSHPIRRLKSSRVCLAHSQRLCLKHESGLCRYCGVTKLSSEPGERGRMGQESQFVIGVVTAPLSICTGRKRILTNLQERDFYSPDILKTHDFFDDLPEQSALKILPCPTAVTHPCAHVLTDTHIDTTHHPHTPKRTFLNPFTTQSYSKPITMKANFKFQDTSE